MSSQPKRTPTPGFRRNPGLEFEFFLATKLGGMTVAEMRRRMSNAELVAWRMFYTLKAEREQREMDKAQRGKRR